MRRPRLVIWGAGGHAKVVADIVRLQGRYVLAGFVDDVDPIGTTGRYLGLPLWRGKRALQRAAVSNPTHLLVALGNCEARLALAERAVESGLTLATAVHPSAVIASDVKMGPGSVVAAAAVICPGCRIGASVIVNTAASVDHDCVIDDGVHVCPGARLAGGVHVGYGAQIGIGASVVEKITIGAEAIIGAGAAVVSNVPARVVAVGVPARVAPARLEAAGTR